MSVEMRQILKGHLARWLLDIVVIGVGTPILKWIWKLIENAALGWADDQLASTLGITGPTMKQVLEIIQGWGPPVILLVLLMYGYHFVSQRLAQSEQKQPKDMSVSQPKPNPFDSLADECQNADATYIKLVRKPRVFVMEWIIYLERLRQERNTHDTVNLFNLIGPQNLARPGQGNVNVGMEEVLFTIKCLAIRGYITFEKSDHGHCTMFDNQNIKFNAKYDELLGKITIKKINGGYDVYW